MDQGCLARTESRGRMVELLENCCVEVRLSEILKTTPGGCATAVAAAPPPLTKGEFFGSWSRIASCDQQIRFTKV